jgi:WD40 repeat protein
LEVKKEVFILNEASDEFIRCLCFSEDNKYFVSGGSTRYVKVWELASG